MPHADPLRRLLLAALLATPLAGLARAPAAAQGFSMHPSEELSQPLPRRPRRPAPPPAASRAPASRAPAPQAPAVPPASPPASAPSQP